MIKLIPAMFLISLSFTPVAAMEKRRVVETEPFLSIKNHRISSKRLSFAVAKLPFPPREESRFWTSIANDPTYPRFHRRCAAKQLFRRHVNDAMTLSELSKLLARPTWLKRNNIGIVKIEGLSGMIPVYNNRKDTIFVIDLFPEKQQCFTAVYLRIIGKVSESDFRDIVLGKGDTPMLHPIRSKKIAEIGFVDSDMFLTSRK